jgi:hypothetical protein
VSVAIQFSSQVLPPSSEKDCSNRHEFEVMSDVKNRTKMARPLSVSWSKNSPAPILDLAHRRLAQRATTDAGEIEVPLVGLWTVQTQAQTFEMTCRPIGFKLDQIGATIPNLSDDRGALVFDPGIGTG